MTNFSTIQITAGIPPISITVKFQLSRNSAVIIQYISNPSLVGSKSTAIRNRYQFGRFFECCRNCRGCYCSLGTQSPFAIHPPRAATRHNAGCGGAGVDRHRVKMASGLRVRMDDQGTNRESGGMRYRKLRIAWSVGCGLLCSLLFVLWVRSTYLMESAESDLLARQRIALLSCYGRLLVALDVGDDRKFPAKAISFPIKKSVQPAPKSSWSFGKRSFPGLTSYYVAVPYWFPVVFLGTMAAAPWIRWSHRFRMRTLLIITAIIAVMLALTATISSMVQEPMPNPPGHDIFK
jgi:hypothetical protein